jgi:hypothetical protein
MLFSREGIVSSFSALLSRILCRCSRPESARIGSLPIPESLGEVLEASKSISGDKCVRNKRDQVARGRSRPFACKEETSSEQLNRPNPAVGRMELLDRVYPMAPIHKHFFTSDKSFTLAKVPQEWHSALGD